MEENCKLWLLGTAVDDEGGGDNLKKVKTIMLWPWPEKIIHWNNFHRKVFSIN